MSGAASSMGAASAGSSAKMSAESGHGLPYMTAVEEETSASLAAPSQTDWATECTAHASPSVRAGGHRGTESYGGGRQDHDLSRPAVSMGAEGEG